MKSKVTKELLPCALTDKEVIARADRLIAIAEDSAALDMELDILKKEHKEQQVVLVTRVKALSREVKSRSADRMVEVEETFYWERNFVERVRRDTDEIISTRPISASERQQQMELDEEKAKAGEKALEEKTGNTPQAKGLKAV